MQAAVTSEVANVHSEVEVTVAAWSSVSVVVVVVVRVVEPWPGGRVAVDPS
tara:strand:- start:468 stop:620 length:153 start_codon:yes stop_codon:yes gene_type:complete